MLSGYLFFREKMLLSVPSRLGKVYGIRAETPGILTKTSRCSSFAYLAGEQEMSLHLHLLTRQAQGTQGALRFGLCINIVHERLPRLTSWQRIFIYN